MAHSSRFILCALVLMGLVFLFLQPRAFSADDAEAVLRGVQEKYGALPGLGVSYTREVITRSMSALGGQLRGDSASGKIFFKAPENVRLEQKHPREERIVSDGEVLWWHIPSEEKAYRYSADKFGKEIGLLADALRGLREVKKDFHVTLIDHSGEGDAGVELRPKTEWQEIDRIVVRVGSEGVIEKVEIRNQLGSTTRFALGPPERIDDFAEGFFRFQPPSGVEVEVSP